MKIMGGPAKSKQMCSGCRDNFYNGNNPYGITECWNFKTATVENRLLIPVDLAPPFKTKPREVLSCYSPERTVNVKPEAINKEGYWKS